MTEPVAAEVFAAIPSGDDDDVVRHALTLQHPQNDHASTGFSIIVLVLAIIRDKAPGVVGGFGELLLAAEFFDEGLRFSF